MPHGRYRHTQEGWFHWLVGVLGAGEVLAGALAPAPAPVRLLVIGIGLLLLALAAAFARLTVEERGGSLVLSFGPLPLFHRSIPYREIRSFRAARSWLVDGWGIHWVPWRGWTWNLWGRDCVEIETVRGGRVRVGTDDPEGLVAHLSARTGSEASP